MHGKRIWRPSIVCGIVLLAASMAQSQDKPTDAEMQAMQKAMMPGPQHQALAKLAGEYTTKSKLKQVGVDDGQGGTATEESAGTAKLTMTHDGRFLQEEDAGTMMGMPFRGTHITGYNNEAEQYEAVWMWSMGTSLMTMTGKSDDGGKTIVFQASYAGAEGKKQQMTITMKVIDDDHLATVIKGDRAEMTTSYTRKR
jgi:hypothetical protein